MKRLFRKRVDKKKIFNIAFYTIGTGVIAVVLFIVSVNFYHNSRLLGENYAMIDEKDDGNQAKDDTNQEQEKADDAIKSDFDTIKFESNEDVYVPIDSQEDEIKNKFVESEEEEDIDTEDIDDEKLPSILLYNHSGVKGLGEKIKEGLKNKSFQVELMDETITRRGTTIVVEQTREGYGVKARDALKMGKLLRELDDDAKHDVIIALGEDYLP